MTEDKRRFIEGLDRFYSAMSSRRPLTCGRCGGMGYVVGYHDDKEVMKECPACSGADWSKR